MKNKKIFIPLVIVLLAVVAYFMFIQWNKEILIIEEKPGVPNLEDDGIVKPVIEVSEERKIPVEVELPLSMHELAVQEIIHAMSHQKVKADGKWGFLPLTQERVQRLIEVVETNESKYDNASIYLDILNRWAENDFSNADKEHNIIWEMQSGTIGRAYGVLSYEEELEFIQKHFNVEIKKVEPE
ncbi:DUF6241 domain-containing protein [Sporosarcina thermotolerans]|uniref:DUF6241 domain-containing protein n=1 Tax=Sporosarcina thermotolerans TaxID=633404 RepID=A0AAW9ACQ1_9BACL|nr:DUF6241 domain-containing protein [Sporosarcina thermotolerans]MDW0118730.1 DUF6241 domain-containing protein [Sporosarcina thermotolerans]WHT48414.1 DUF6241 domain-containing protein [Sporosarcina thermotolerans]